MPFTISPTEAQAIQEDEVQLINAIAQVAQRIPGILNASTNNGTGQQPGNALRIKMGRRLVYGQLADGLFRHELDANSLKVIADALQRPITPDVDPEKYARKIPAIEIFHGDVLLFREERDGAVTTNEINFQVEQAGQQAQSPARSEANAAISPQETKQSPRSEVLSSSLETEQAQKLLTTAQYLLNPLRQPESIYDQVSIQGYQIQKQGQNVTVSQGERVLLQAEKSEIVSNRITEQDWIVFSQIQIPERFPKPVLNDLPKASLNEVPQLQEKSETQVEAVISTETMPDMPLPTETLETSTVLAAATEDVIPDQGAIAILDRETQNLPVSSTRQLLQSAVQDWRQQVSQRFSTRLQKGMSWLVTQQTALQNQRLAHTVHRLFQRGYERTGEHSYHGVCHYFCEEYR
jgi:hypothetical protein